jgi:hypothetical protein
VPLVLGALAVVLGALVAGGSVADRGNPAIAGILVGAACAVLGFLATRALFERVARRLDPEARGALPSTRRAPRSRRPAPASCSRRSRCSSSAASGALLVTGRRREGEKYAGLRILR